MRNPSLFMIRPPAGGRPRERWAGQGSRRTRTLALAACLTLAATLLPSTPAGAAEVPTTKETARPPATPGAKKKKKPEPRAKRKQHAPGAAGKAMADRTTPDSHEIRGKAPRITPFPREAAAVDKAFAEHRRDQMVDAEKAAREPESKDRWRTVLFFLRDLQSRPDPEACFWRVLAFYRLGELGRARRIREDCDFPPRDRAALDEEDVLAAGLQPASALPELRLAGEEKEVPNPADFVVNTAAYSGPSPTQVK